MKLALCWAAPEPSTLGKCLVSSSPSPRIWLLFYHSGVQLPWLTVQVADRLTVVINQRRRSYHARLENLVIEVFGHATIGLYV